MTYDAHDEARDAMYEAIADELYPSHKEQAITEFTRDRLQSYYVANPEVMKPAVAAIQEGRKLQANSHNSAAVVFFVTAIELLLKATLLKPVVHGLVHNEALGEIIVQQALGQPGLDRYSKLLAKLFSELVSLDISAVRRTDVSEPLLTECTAQQALRNRVIHQGAAATAEQAELSKQVSVAVYELVVHPMLAQLGLRVIEHGEIQSAA
jgi:hypothetical protein